MDQENMLDEFLPAENTAPKRPVSITIICVAYLVFMLILIPFQIKNVLDKLNWGTVFLLSFVTMVLLSIVGLWKMKKWGAYAFILVYILSQVLSLSRGSWSLYASLIPTIASGIVFFHLKKMRN
jgi:hypothetical protein